MTLAVSISPDNTNRAVVDAAASRKPVLDCAKHALKDMLLSPRNFFVSRPLGVMLALYSGTYLVANTTDTITSYKNDLPPSSTTSSTSKFCAVTSVNLGLALYKDNCFAQTFGPASAGALRPLPPISFIPLVIRDGITLFFTFNAPALLSDRLPEGLEQHMSRLTAAQLACPAASQFIATPLHLLGLDLYNRPAKLSIRERMSVIRSLWLSSSLARACRMVPAYGLGSVLNNDARAYFMQRFENPT
ncbi:putative membrane protein [Pseudocercospora fuligena]|uniref:Putative membrane protein n=1 Tax=Pseudocercospora fuligena TaxID=685502 RepID=A0A8H6RWY3_9PEZI|nr:putative membrane protein [Pseudocercospora fuligena]